MKLLRYIANLSSIVLCTVYFSGCTVEEPDYRDLDYGYVQFKLYKEASSPLSKAGKDPLEYLHDATKIRVSLAYGDDLINQTLTLDAKDREYAEYGIRSEKLKLLVGRYAMVSFILYDAKDNVVYEDRSPGCSFDIVSDGLWSQELNVDVIERGQVRFYMKKEFASEDDAPLTRATDEGSQDEGYTFDQIGYVSLTVRHITSKKEESLTMLPAKFSVHFDEEDEISDKEGYQTSSIVCDTLITLLGGEYELLSYTTFNESKKQLELNVNPSECLFTVSDNELTDVSVKVTLLMKDSYLQDYKALKKIYDALGGDDWYYIGENFQKGTKWDFNKDIDLWGDQPGVQLHANGRVALLDLSNFGFYGHMPDELGNLTELIELYLGTHNDTNVYTDVPGAGSSDALRKQRAKEYLRRTHPATQFSEPIARAMMEKGVSIPEMEMYEKYAEREIIDTTGQMIIRPMDTNPGTIINGLKSLPESIGNLKNLQKISIANSTLSELPAAFADLESCTDLELYNLPEMKVFPEVLAHMPAIVQLNLSCNPQWEAMRPGYVRCDGRPGTEADFGLHVIAHKDEDGDDTNGLYRSYKTLQMIYMNVCGLTEVTRNISNLKSLGMLSLSYNSIDNIYPFGSDIVMVQLYLDHNKLEKIPVDGNGEFCGMDDVETLSFNNNKLTELPDIFTSKSKFIMSSVDFSNNLITKVQNGVNYKGINVETLSMTNNPIETFPVEFAQSKSKVAYFNFRGCRINNIPKKAFDLSKESSGFLMSIDLSYNDLSALPETFNATNIPYLYGLELSYNEFSKFPYNALDCSGLTVFGIRGQRNKSGERCLSEWPQNIRQHTGLRGFYIGSNNLGKIEDTISPICYYLEVSDNPHIILDASSVCYEYSIGAYYLIYDKRQDIRGCDLMK